MFWHRWRIPILVFWFAVTAVMLPLARNVTHGLTTGGFEDPRSSAAWATRMLGRFSASQPPQVSLLVQGMRAGAVEGRWERVAARVGLPPAAAQAVHVVELPSGAVAVNAAARGPWAAQVQAGVQALRRSLARVPGTRVEDVNAGTVGNEILREAERTLRVSSQIALPIVVVLLLLVYDSVVAAVLPFVVALVGAVLTLGVVDLLEARLSMSVFLTDIVSFLALGVGVDYSLFVSSRFRSALRQGKGVVDAVSEAMGTAGRSVFFSGLAVGLCLLTLLIPGTSYWNGLAVGGCVAVFSVVAVTLTLLPALLSMLGAASEWGRLPRLPSLERFWPFVGRVLTRRPGVVLAVGVCGLGLLAVPGVRLRMAAPANLASLLAPTTPLAQAVAAEQRDFGPGVIAPMPVVLQSPYPLSSARTWTQVLRVARRLRRLPGAREVQAPDLPAPELAALFASPLGPPPPLRTVAAGRHLVLVNVISRYGPDSPGTSRLLSQMKATLRRTLPEGWRYGVGGVVGLIGSFNALVGRTVPWVLGAAVGVALLVLLAATGSLAISVLAVAFDALVALATAGLLVLVVQEGRLGFVPGPLNSSMVPLMFVVLFGLSMDYEVILIHRIREYARRGLSSWEAARRGIVETGGMITGAGMIMVVVFVVELASRLQVIRTLAVGLTAGLLLDTWVVRTLLVPTSTALLGRGGWWPAAWARRHAAVPPA